MRKDRLMPSSLRSFAVLAVLALTPTLAQAGWVIEWNASSTNQKGQNMPAQKATQSISGNQVRMEQPEVITIVDYNKDRFVMMNPVKQYFWSGSTDQYVSEMTHNRDAAMRERIGDLTGDQKKQPEPAADPTPRTIDPAKLPPVSITSAGVTEKIA